MIPALEIRQRLGRKTWGVPEPFGPGGWRYKNKFGNGVVIVTISEAPGEPDGAPEWVHASMSRADDVPSYEDLVHLHKAVWPNGYAYQVFAPPSSHVNIHPNVLHLWGRADGKICLPDFGMHGTI